MTDLDDDLFNRMSAYVGWMVRIHTRYHGSQEGRLTGIRLMDRTHELVVELNGHELYHEPTGVVVLKEAP